MRRKEAGYGLLTTRKEHPDVSQGRMSLAFKVNSLMITGCYSPSAARIGIINYLLLRASSAQISIINN